MHILTPPISLVDAIFKLIVPLVVIALSEEVPVKPVPGVIEVTVPVFLVNPHPETVDDETAVAPEAISSSLDLSVALINPAALVVATE